MVGMLVQVLPCGAVDEVHGVAVASCLLLSLGLGQLNLLLLHHCTGDVAPMDLPIDQQLCFRAAAKYFTGTTWKNRIASDLLV